MNGDDFISKLVEETMSHTTEQDNNVECDVIELENYFNRKNRPVVEDQNHHEIHVNRLEFITKVEMGVYRLDCRDEIWDFPMNWSVFEMMDEGCSITIRSNHKHSHLIKAFSHILNCEVVELDFDFNDGKLACEVKSYFSSQLAAA
jgi:hypothetical protein